MQLGIRASWLHFQVKHTVWVHNCTFRNNYAQAGGAAMVVSGPGTDATITTSNFVNNSALPGLADNTSRGGALQLSGCFAVRLSGCEVSNNGANTAGGISMQNVRMLFIDTTRFFANLATATTATTTSTWMLARDSSGSGGALDILPISQAQLPPMQVYDWPGPILPPPPPPPPAPPSPRSPLPIEMVEIVETDPTDDPFMPRRLNEGRYASGTPLDGDQRLRILVAGPPGAQRSPAGTAGTGGTGLASAVSASPARVGGVGLGGANGALSQESGPQAPQGDISGQDGDYGGPLAPSRGLSDPLVHIQDCTFEGNNATSGQVEAGGGMGGAINVRDWPWLVVERCTFVQNNARAGGAINLDASSNNVMDVTVSSCSFVNNTAMADAAQSLGGAAVKAATGGGSAQCFLRLRDSRFHFNNATNGGAVFVQGQGVSLTASRCSFRGNIALSANGIDGSGGSLCAASISQLLLRDSNITDCRAGSGGGLYVSDAPDVRVTRCLIASNTALARTESVTGGGMTWNSRTTVQSTLQASIVIQNSTFDSNSAASSYAGGLAVQHAPLAWRVNVQVQDSVFRHNRAGRGAGLYQASPQSNLIISNTEMFNNTAYTAAAGATAASSAYGSGGGLAVEQAASLLMTRTRIHGCTAARGAGIAISSVTQVWITNCTVSDNTAVGVLPDAVPPSLEALGGTGGGLWLSDDGSGALEITSSIFRRNYAGLLGGGMALLRHPCQHQAASSVAAAPLPALPPGPAAPAAPNAALSSDVNAPGLGDAISNGSASSSSLSSGLGGPDAPCTPLVFVRSIIRDNFAYDSGGGIFSTLALSSTLAPSVSCSDLGSIDSQPAKASSTSPSVCNDLNNTVRVGYGPNLATSPGDMRVAEVATQRTRDGASPASRQNPNPELFLSAATPQAAPSSSSYSSLSTLPLPSYQSLVFPSSLATSRELLQLVIRDSLGQVMAGPWFGQMYVIGVTRSLSPSLGINARSAPHAQQLGHNLVVYKDTTNASAFLIDAMILIAYGGRIHERHPLTFTLAPAVDHGRQILSSTLDAIVPPCMNGEATRYLGGNTTCERCIAGMFAFMKASDTATSASPANGQQSQLESVCSVCPQEANCPGGPVILPMSGYWHSHPQSTSMVQCLYGPACDQLGNKTRWLSECKEAWFTQLHRPIYAINSSESESEPLPDGCVALGLGKARNVTLLSLLSDNRTYTDLLCNNGYGGNLCGVCVAMQDGTQTGMQGNFQCNPCPERWRTIAISLALFFANLLMVAIQVMGTMGEQLQSCNLRSLEASDLISLLITHLQCLVVIFKLNIQWPSAVVGLSQFAVTFASISEQYTRATSISCLSDGSPEAQATYIMAWGLASPAVLIIISVCSWCLFWLFRHRRWYRARGSNSLSPSPSKLSAAALSRSLQIGNGATTAIALPGAALPEDEEASGGSQPVTPGYPGQAQGTQGLRLSSEVQICVGDGSQIQGPMKADIEEVEVRITLPAPHPVSEHCMGACPDVPGTHVTPEGADKVSVTGVTADAPYVITSAANKQAAADKAALPRGASMRTLSSRASDASVINVDIGDSNTLATNSSIGYPRKASGKSSKILKSGKLSISSMGSLRRRMPSMEDVREPTTWLNKAPEGGEEQDDESLQMGLMENLALLDTFMTLKQQVAVVLLCAYFVVYQAWSSAALNVFSCYFIDSSTVSSSYPSFYAYFQAAAATNGYWKLNLNQACYEGQHLSVWTPVGVVCSVHVLVAFGLPVLQFLPVFLNRKRLQEPDVRFRYGRLYLSYFYNRVPYWGAARQLQLLVLIVVQVFSDGLKSPVQQATMLQNTLLLFMIINLAVWPMVSPMLVLMDFLSAAVLIATLSLGIPFSDTNNTIGEGYANTCGALILIVNSLYLIVLVFLCGRAFMTTSGRKLKTLGGAIKKVVSKVHHKSMLRLTKKGSQGSLPKSSSGRSGQVRQASLVQLPTTVPEDSVCD